METTDTAVSSDVGSATTETTSSPDTTSSVDTQSTSPAPQTPASRSYRDEDVQRIVRERLASEQRKYEKRLAEAEKRQKEYEAMTQRLNHGFEQFGRGLGFIQDEQPKPVTEKDLQSRLEQIEQKWAQQQEQAERQRIYHRIESEWKQVQASIEWADMPGFKHAWAEKWDPNKDPVALGKEIAAFYEKRFASRQNTTAEAKEERAKVVPVKPSTPTPSAAKKDEKLPLRKRIIAATKSARGE